MNLNVVIYKAQSAIKNRFLWIWLVGSLLTASCYFASEYYYQSKAQEKAGFLLDQAVELVKIRFEKYEYGLLSTRGAMVIAGTNSISRNNFKRYVSSLNLENSFPGAKGVGFIRRVPTNQQNSFLQQMRADGAPNFNIRTLTAHNNDRFIIQYIYPEIENSEAIGLDIGSEQSRRVAAVTAALSNKATLSAPITLVQEKGKPRRGFLILLPVYKEGVIENKLRTTIGWVYEPLTVDDVLFEFAPQLSEICLTITDKAEDTPFFDTHNKNIDGDVFDIKVSREIDFMGRQWVITATPHEYMNFGILAASPAWILFIGFVITSVFSFIVQIWQIKNVGSAETKDKEISFSAFFSSVAFKKLSKGYLLIMLCIFVISGYLYVQQAFNVTADSLISHSRYSKGLITKQRQSYSDGLNFIKSSPAITVMMRSQFDQRRRSALIMIWKDRLAETFKAYMQSLDDVYQIRLISADKYGEEIVRVEREGGGIIVTPHDKLQRKGDRSYFTETLKLKNDRIYVSSIEPNYENGEMQIPIRLTRRYATPIFYPDGTPFAVLVINVEADSLLREIKSVAQDGETIYIINGNGGFILADDDAKVYSSFYDQKYTWQSIFKYDSVLFQPNLDGISAWKSDRGTSISAEIIVSPNHGEEDGSLRVLSTQATSKIYEHVFSLLLKQLFTLIAFSLLALTLFYFSWVNSKRDSISAQIKRELTEQKQKDNMFESLTELSPEAMVIIDADGTIVLVNSQTEKLFGYNREQLLNENISMLVPATFATGTGENIHSYTDESLHLAKDLTCSRANGSDFPVEINLSTIRLDTKFLIALSIRDVSQRKLIENSLKETIEDAKSASQAKSIFLANMSHEIRTPLNAVIGFTHLLKGSDLSPHQSSLVDKIQLAGGSLLSIINDVLDLAKIEANEMNVALDPFNLQVLLEDVINVFSGQAETKHIELYLDISTELPLWITSDRKFIQQIITNLLGNAIKFTSKGKVTLKATVIADTSLPSTKQLIRFTIEDSGIGIEAKKLKKIFTPFNQADDGKNRRFEGTGLGLSIVQNLSELLAGKVGVDSELNKGSQFWFQAPFLLTKLDNELVNNENYSVLNIWVIEALNNQKEMLSNLAMSLGWKVFRLSSGNELISEFKQSLKQKTNFPDLLLVDWQLHQFDTLPFLDVIYKMPEWQSIPIVAVISPEQKEDIKSNDIRKRVMDFLFNPVSITELFNAVNSTISQYSNNTIKVLESTKTDLITAKWLPNIRILAVDDSAMNLEVIDKILTNNGALVTTADSAAIAIGYLESDAQQFDVVLMDVQMPVMDGLEATLFIRNQLNITNLPIIALTAGIFEGEKNKALASGMNEFLTKPIDPAKLVLCLRKHVEIYRKEPVMLENVEVFIDHGKVQDWPEIEGIINSQDLFQGNLTLFEFTLKRLFEEFEDIKILKGSQYQLYKAEDRDLLAGKLHKLRGCAGMVGAKALYNLASNAEKSLRKGENAEHDKLSNDIVNTFNSLKENCKDFLKQQQDLQIQKNHLDLSKIKAIDPADLDKLIDVLESNDLSAAKIAENHHLEIVVLLGEQKSELFNNYVQVLNYDKAAEILRKHSG